MRPWLLVFIALMLSACSAAASPASNFPQVVVEATLDEGAKPANAKLVYTQYGVDALSALASTSRPGVDSKLEMTWLGDYVDLDFNLVCSKSCRFTSAYHNSVPLPASEHPLATVYRVSFKDGDRTVSFASGWSSEGYWIAFPVE